MSKHIIWYSFLLQKQSYTVGIYEDEDGFFCLEAEVIDGDLFISTKIEEADSLDHEFMRFYPRVPFQERMPAEEPVLYTELQKTIIKFAF